MEGGGEAGGRERDARAQRERHPAGGQTPPLPRAGVGCKVYGGVLAPMEVCCACFFFFVTLALGFGGLADGERRAREGRERERRVCERFARAYTRLCWGM